MVATTKIQSKAWKEVGTRFTALEVDLRRRLDRVNTDALTERRSVERALESLVDSLEHSFDGIGAAVRDVELRQDITKVVNSIREAIAATFAQPSRATTATKKQASARARSVGSTTARKTTARKTTARKTTASTPVATKARPASKTRVAPAPSARKGPAKKAAARTTTRAKGKATVA